MSCRVSIVIPTYNEAGNVAPLIDRIYGTVQDEVHPEDAPQVVVIDDNSPDGTGQLCLSLRRKYPSLKTVIRTDARGLGSAVQRGILESDGDTIVVMDADFSHDCDLIPTLVAAVDSGSTDIAIASRYVPGGKMVASPHLSLGSRALNWFVRTVLGIPIRDLTGGFFAAKRSTLQGLESETVFTGYGDYSFALLYKGFKRGLRMQEYPFEYSPRQDGMTKTKYLRAGLSYGLRAIRLRMGLE
ncbi:MAG: glycosyltransferase [Dehalococcoidia bacterium]|nr:glycosyltransferase [Dehalococcoidia bacterium]